MLASLHGQEVPFWDTLITMPLHDHRIAPDPDRALQVVTGEPDEVSPEATNKTLQFASRMSSQLVVFMSGSSGQTPPREQVVDAASGL